VYLHSFYCFIAFSSFSFRAVVNAYLGGAKNAGVENAGVENAGAYRRVGKFRSDKVWKAIRKNNLKHQTKYGCRGFLAYSSFQTQLASESAC